MTIWLCVRDEQIHLSLAGSQSAEGKSTINLKEHLMTEAPQLEFVELGDAKEETKGQLEGTEIEASQAKPYRVL